MRPGSIQLARILGIRIGAGPSWFVVLFLMIYVLTGYFGDVLDGSNGEAFAIAVAGALLFFASLVLHELGHAIVARRNGIEIAGIELWFFGGLARMNRDSRTAGEEFRVAAAGPAVTLLVVVVCLGVALALSEGGQFFDSARFDAAIGSTSPGIALLGWLGAINTFLFLFNMIPAFPLDGGRIARAVAWQLTGDKTRSTRFSGRIGQAFGYALIGIGIVVAAQNDTFNGLSLMVLGYFLGQAARGAIASSDFQERIEGVTVGDLMDPSPVTLPGAIPALEAQDTFFDRYGWSFFPVVDENGGLLGILDRDRVDAAVADGRPALPTAELVEAAPEEDRVRATEPLESLLSSVSLARRGALMVVDADGRLCGVVTVEQVRRALAAAAPRRVA